MGDDRITTKQYKKKAFKRQREVHRHRLLLAWTISGDVSSLTTLVTSFWRDSTGGVWTFFGDMTVSTTSVTLDSVCVTVTGVMVSSTTVVTSGTLRRSSWVLWSSRLVVTGRVWTVSGDVSGLTTRVTFLSRDNWFWTLTLDMARLVTVVTLLATSLLWLRTFSGFVTWLSAVVAQPLGLFANLCEMSNLSTLVTSSREYCCHLLSSYSLTLAHALARLLLSPTRRSND